MAYIIVNSEGIISEADSHFGEIFGLQIHDLLGSGYLDFKRAHFEGLTTINEKAFSFYISNQTRISLISCVSNSTDTIGETRIDFSLINSPQKENESWSELTASLKKISSVQNAKIAFIDVHGSTIWMNDSLLEFEKNLKKSYTDLLLDSILQHQTKKYHTDINSCWILGTVYSAYYSIHSKSYQLYFTPYCYEKNALAGFQIEIKEIESAINTLSMEELSLFPLKNPLPILRISKQAEVLFANAAALNKFCNKDGRLKKDIQYQFETAIASAQADNKAQFFRIEISDTTLSSVLQKANADYHVYCSDITEIAKAERKNEDNMALMDAIVNSASNSIILINQNRKVTFFNQKAKIESRRHFGYQLIHGEELPDFDEIGFTKTLNRSVDAVFKGGKQISFDIELKEPERGLMWFNFTVFPVMNHIGIVNSVCLNILNITDAKNAEIEIKETKKFYETILNNIPSDIAVFDLNQNYLFINPPAIQDEKVRKWLIGKNDYDYFRFKGIKTDIADKRKEVFLQTIKSKETNEIVDHHVKADGSETFKLRRFYPYFEDNELKLVIGYGLDISDIKIEQKKSKLVENKFKSLFENNPMFLFILDKNYHILSTNTAARRHFSIDENELPGFLFLDLIESNFCSEFQSKFNDAFSMEMNQSHSCYCQLKRKDVEFTVEFTATPVISDTGEKHLLLAGTDHTDKLKNQERLRLSEEFNRKLVQDMPVPFAIINWDKAEFMNQACRNLVELDDAEDFTGKSLFEFLHEDDFSKVQQNLKNRYDGLSVPPSLIRVKTRKQNERFVEINGGLMILNDRKVNFVTFIDKTAEIIEGKARNTAELRTKQIIETALDAVITANSKGEIQDWNPKAEEIFGWKASEAKGRNINETIIPSGMRHMHNSGMDRHLATGESRVLNRPLELSAITKMGKEFPVELFTTRFEVEGEILFSSFIRDITDRKAAQEALLESESKLSILVSTLPVVPYTTQFNSNYSFTYLSDRIDSLFGYNVQEILNQEGFWFSRVFKDDIHIVEEGQKNLLEEGEANLQYRIKDASGKLIWVRDSMRLVLGAIVGEPYLITGVFQDVTQMVEEEERRKLIDKTLFDISRQELSAKGSLNDFYGLVFNNLNQNIDISRMSFWEMSSVGSIAECTNYFSSTIDDRLHIGSQIKMEKILEKLNESNIIYSNSADSKSIQENRINSVFDKTVDVSLLLCLVKGASNENKFLLIETDQRNFKWEYEHFTLVNSISELVSINVEYFNRIESDGKLREAYKMAKIGAWEIDQESNKVIWSESMFDFYNLNSNETAPLNFNQALEYHHQEDRPTFLQVYNNLLQNLEPYTFGCRHVYENGDVRYFEKSAMARKNALNKITFMGVTFDITEKKLAEIEQEKIKIKQLLSNTLGARISNVDSQEELIQIFSGLLIETKFIKNCCYVVTQQVNSLESSYNINKFYPNKKISAALENEVLGILHDNLGVDEKAKTSFMKLISKDKILGSFSVSGQGDAYMIYQMVDDGNAIESKMDILDLLTKMVQEKSERIYSEAQVKELNVELLDTNIQLRQYSFIVSHNLRAPIANILGCLNIYNDKDPSAPKNKQLLEGLRISANSVDGILQDLNKILNIKENVSKQYEFVRFDKTLELVIDSIRKDMMDVDHELISDFSKMEGLQSFRPYLVSIFQNILSNSFKYREPSRKLLVSISTHTDGEKTIIKFSDNGRGIDLQKHGGRLFKLYSRFHADVAGTGIGLNMVKEQARVMGGSIHIESKLDDGTTFTITFVNRK